MPTDENQQLLTNLDNRFKLRFTENDLYNLVDGSYFGACMENLAIKSSTGSILGYVIEFARIALINYRSEDAELFALNNGIAIYATRRAGFYTYFKQVTL